jgi:hypothetical protein
MSVSKATGSSDNDDKASKLSKVGCLYYTMSSSKARFDTCLWYRWFS